MLSCKHEHIFFCPFKKKNQFSATFLLEYLLLMALNDWLVFLFLSLSISLSFVCFLLLFCLVFHSKNPLWKSCIYVFVSSTAPLIYPYLCRWMISVIVSHLSFLSILQNGFKALCQVKLVIKKKLNKQLFFRHI